MPELLPSTLIISEPLKLMLKVFGASVSAQGRMSAETLLNRLTPKTETFLNRAGGNGSSAAYLVELLKLDLIVSVVLTSGEQIVAVTEVDWLLPSKGFSDARRAVVEPVHLEK